MKKDRIKNVRVSKGIKKVIGTIVLVDSLIIGVVSLGGHVPIYQDDKRVNMVIESRDIDYGDHHDITVSNYYEEEIELQNRVIYYKKPYSNEHGRFREIETVYSSSYGPAKKVRVVPVNDPNDNESYIETIEYNFDTDHYYVTKETLYDEIKSDAALLLILGCIDTGIYSVGASLVRRKEEEENKTK